MAIQWTRSSDGSGSENEKGRDQRSISDSVDFLKNLKQIRQTSFGNFV